MKQALPTWVKFPFKNILILNWNSDDTKELHEFVDSFKDDRIILVDVVGKRTTYFSAPISRNMAAERCLELTKPTFLLQIDSDIKIHDSMEHLALEDDNVIYMSKWARFLLHPNWESFDSTFAKNSLNIEIVEKNRLKYGSFGTCLIPADKVFKYGYYNENFIENNLFDTLYMANFFNPDEEDNIWFFRNEVEHIDHDNESRIAEGTENSLRRALQVNHCLRTLPPYRYPFTIIDDHNIRID